MIVKSWVSGCWQWKIVVGVVTGTFSVGVPVVLAQVVPDNTLGAESSVVTPNGNIEGLIRSDRIDGGAIRGANLFHSFQEFNVGESRSVYFANPTGIENILTRVTGSNPSNILGRLGVLDGANLLLLNPNGVIYGPNAQLDIEGSFLTSTASSFTFSNGSEFSATNPQAAPLLAISVPLGLQYGNNPRSIQVQGSNLQVNPGKTLALVGGSVSIDGGQIQAPGGRIELGGVAEASTVGLTVNDSYISLSFPISDNVLRSDVFLDNGTIFDVSAGGDGNLAINAQNLKMMGGSRLRAGSSWLVSSNSSPGNIEINATGAINLTEDSLIENSVFDGATGKGGDINITAGSLTVTNNAQLRANSFGKGDTGNLNIITRDFISFDGVGSKAENVIASGAEGQGGQINITTRSLSVSGGATLVAHTIGKGNAGNVIIKATDTVALEGFSTGIGSQVFAGSQGNGGNINITTGNLSASSGATLAANTLGKGNAGNVIIKATDTVALEGSSTGIGSQVFAGAEGNGGSINITTGNLSASNGATLVTNASEQGNGGSIDIITGNLSASGGATLAANTSGKRNAGNVTIKATNTVALEGAFTGIGSQVLAGAEGNGGSINITTDNLSASNGASLTANTSGKGNAGNVTINATDTVTLQGSSTGIGSQVLTGAEGNGGSINITTGNLSASNGATLAANTSEQGKGGSINITTGNLSASNGATLAANTLGKGNAGNVTINATDTVTLQGSSTGIGSQVFAGAEGKGGSINITTGNLSASNGATLAANTLGKGNAGNVTINATDTVTLQGSSTGIGSQVFAGAEGNGGSIDITTGNLSAFDGATLVANTSGKGNAGNVTIKATDTVTLQGSSTGIGSQVLRSSQGNGGNIDITTGNLSAFDGATLVVNTSGKGNAGNVTIKATDTVFLQGVGINTQVTGVGSQVLETAEGKGGNIDIIAGSLAVTNGARLIASTSGQGNGGNVTIRVRDQVSFDGVGSNGISSGVFSSTEVGGIGKGGDIRITTDKLRVFGGAVLDARTQNDFKAGNITVEATKSVDINQASLLARSNGTAPAGNVKIETGDLTARNGTVTTSSQRSSGGEIAITAASNIRLFGDSDITTNVSSGAGGGGNITLKADSILAFDDSDILAFARDGKGGDIILNTPAFFGENYRPAPGNTTPDSLNNNNRVDINATGAVSGVINRPDVSFIQNSLSELPENQINTDSLLANSCIVRRNQPTKGSFTVTGSGGFTQRPGDTQISSFSTVDVESLPSNDTMSNTSQNRSWQKGEPIVEPQGAYRLPNGKLVLSRECS